jgi:hypothetical protein
MSVHRPDLPCSAFAGPKKIAQGPFLEVVEKSLDYLKKHKIDDVQFFDDQTSDLIEVDLRGKPEAVLARLSPKEEGERKVGPGRPKLGVVSREIGLLPSHWDWLALQPGGASVTLRKLVEEAKKKSRVKDEIRRSQNSTYKFMTTMAGNLPHYEEALRALFANDRKTFDQMVKSWPKDIREHIDFLASECF